MRAIAIAVTSLVLVGCNPELAAPPAATASSLVAPPGTDYVWHPQPDPNYTCVDICSSDGPGADPWQGRRGYVLSNPIGGPSHGATPPVTGIVGIDATLTTVLWRGEITTPAQLQYYLTLPGTIPLQCVYTLDAGQVGAGNTDTGGSNHKDCDRVCFSDADLSHLQQSCMCHPQTPATACGAGQCGVVSDGCAGSISCGCPPGSSCTDGQCVCRPRNCGKGNYWNPDSCACEHGLPQ